MIEKLKKKYMANCIFATVLLWALAAVFVAITWDDLNVLFQKPLKIEDLKAEDIQKNVKVEGDIYYFMDYYAYQENDKGGMTAMQFMVPVGEAEYMGVNCSGSTMNRGERKYGCLLGVSGWRRISNGQPAAGKDFRNDPAAFG